MCQASERLSGRMGAAPVGDPNQQRMANGLRRRPAGESSDDDSSSEDDRRGPALSDRQTRRAARRERRDARREMRHARRERKARGEDKVPYELYITAV